ncbi:ATP-binding protein [Tenacibaculum piscium]|uniref:ATP-binding protein n=1 Tax=Tenacibaculum piscium TaxID=1458515 RepID=UPI001F42B5DD|nr:ATP-binding protein [Tenacibaculum piscium]
MEYSNNISTNIVRDESKLIDYVVTPNTKEIFDRIFINNHSANKSFNLIGNYGTGKSTFIWALEKNLKREKIFFNNIDAEKNNVIDYDFIKIIGENDSLLNVIGKKLKIDGVINNSKIIVALEKIRKKAETAKKGIVLVIDEFGKLLEYASKNNSLDELFLLQQISEWANNDLNDTYFIITLHQNFASYGNDLSSQDKSEWEKVKGRFVDLVFNEPVEQLIYFASKKLKKISLPKSIQGDFKKLSLLIQDSKLVSHNKLVNKKLTASLYPLDWLSSNILVKSLQRYGQNERSLFSFLNDTTDYSIHKLDDDFYTVSNVYDYLVNTLSTEINNSNNPHRTQWLTTFRALERAELIFKQDYLQVSKVIKTIGLVNIFSKIGGLFDKEFITNYFSLTKNGNVSSSLEKLEKAGIIRFYKHSNKINFLEGTDLDLEQELITVSREINPNFSISSEIKNLINLPVLLVKRYSFETGTRRFFEYRIFNRFQEITKPEGIIDGYINLVFDDLNISDVKNKSKEFVANIFVLYKNSSQIKNEILMILKFNHLLEKHQNDKNALELLNSERKFHLQQLENLVINQLFNNDKNIWINNGEIMPIVSKHKLYEWLTKICYQIYEKTPIFNNELINKEFLSTPINTARKYLTRSLLANKHLKDLNFPTDKFPPQKAIYISLLKESGIHQKNEKLGYYELNQPDKNSNLYDLWNLSEQFLKSSLSNKRNLLEFYEILEQKPYKLKKGFITFWIPIFLIAKKEDYALFHTNGGFVPFITDDTIDLIYKKPQDFLIKSYDVSGLKVNLLESYKELVQIGDSNLKGTQSTFLAIFGNFLKFQRGLNKYTLKTSKLSIKATKLREAILIAKDPEDALFNLFPTALGFHSLAIKEDTEVLQSFTNHTQDAIREIRNAYGELLNRVEKTITASFYCKSSNFDVYKDEIQAKINGINPATLGKTQNVFYKRLISPLDDRISWIKSVADVALGKGLDTLIDEEEPLLMNSIKDLSLGLIKASEIRDFNSNSNKETLYSIRFFGETGEFIDNTLVVNTNTSKEFKSIKKSISDTINKLDIAKRKELLIELLSKEMHI